MSRAIEARLGRRGSLGVLEHLKQGQKQHYGCNLFAEDLLMMTFGPLRRGGCLRLQNLIDSDNDKNSRFGEQFRVTGEPIIAGQLLNQYLEC